MRHGGDSLGVEASGFDLDLAQATGEPAFTVDLDGFEGPLDLLLELARRQRVDLARISILALAEQYLHFIEAARKLRLELAADYLVMAAWLAFLKSRLLLPTPAQPTELDAPALAEGLAQRLRTLAAFRNAGEYLMSRPRLGRDFFARGEPDVAVETSAARVSYHAELYDLLAAYARRAQSHALARVRFKAREVWSLSDARQALARLVGQQSDWTALDSFLTEACADAGMRRSARASTFAASLELAREGKIELRQERAFAPIWMRSTDLNPGEERAA
jgi:segregation and condensation protein A